MAHPSSHRDIQQDNGEEVILGDAPTLLPRTTLHDEIVVSLRDMIVDGTLPAGPSCPRSSCVIISAYHERP